MKQHGPKIKILKMVVEFSKATAMHITDRLKKREKNYSTTFPNVAKLITLKFETI